MDFCREPGEESFAAFYEMTKGLVYTIAVERLGSEDDAIDILQSVYCELLETARCVAAGTAQVDIEQEVRHVARRLSSRIAKRRSRSRARMAGAEMLDALPDTRMSAADAAQQGELREKVGALIDRLPEKYRLPILLHYVHGMELDEVAEATGARKNTVIKQITRGLTKLEALAAEAGLAGAVTLLAALFATKHLLVPPARCSAALVYRAAMQAPPVPYHAGFGQTLGQFGRTAARVASSKTASGAAIGVGLVSALLVVALVTRNDLPRAAVAPQPAAARAAHRPQARSADVARPQSVPPDRRTNPAAHVPAATAAGAPPQGAPAPAIAGRVVSLPGFTGMAGLRVTANKVEDYSVVAEAVTDADGQFRFDGMDKPVCFVQLHAGGKYDNYVARVRPGENNAGGPVFYLGGSTWRGRVTRGGTPCHQAVVSLRVGEGPEIKRTVLTSKSGAFELGLVPAGTWTCEVSPHDDRLAHLARLEIVEVGGANAEPAELRLPSAGLHGLTVDASARPLPGVLVTALRLPESGQPLDAFVPRRFEQVSGVDGHFRIDDIPPGTYTVEASAAGQRTARPVTVTAPFDGLSSSARLALAAQAGATLVSTARDRETGRPVPQAWCLLARDGRPFDHGYDRGHDGVLEIPGVPPGRYTVQVSAYGYSVATHDLEIHAGQTCDISDLLEPRGAFEWTIEDARRRPVTGVPCRVFPAASVASDAQETTGVTGGDGRMVVRGLHPGDYVALTTGGDISASVAFAVRAHELTSRLSTVEVSADRSRTD